MREAGRCTFPCPRPCPPASFCPSSVPVNVTLARLSCGRTAGARLSGKGMEDGQREAAGRGRRTGSGTDHSAHRPAATAEQVRGRDRRIVVKELTQDHRGLWSVGSLDGDGPVATGIPLDRHSGSPSSARRAR